MVSTRPSLSPEIWDKAQESIKIHQIVKSKDVESERPKLYGRVWDYHGNRMTATYSYKYGKSGRYKMRYYQNQEIYRRGKTSSEFKRIRSHYLDDVIIDRLTDIIACTNCRYISNQ
jgi:nuclear transport factor 2 (NTF2) superfamily protein